MHEKTKHGFGPQDKRQSGSGPKEKRASGGGAGKTSVISSVSSLPILLDLNDFKNDFVFDGFFDQLVQEILGAAPTTTSKVPSTQHRKESLPLNKGSAPAQVEGASKLITGVAFPEAKPMLRVFKDGKEELIELGNMLVGQLERLKKEVVVYESKCQDQFLQLKKALEGSFECFTRLDKRVTGVAQTAARISDQLQHTDKQKDCAYETVDLMKYMAEFISSSRQVPKASNGHPTKASDQNSVKFIELSPIFRDDNMVAEAAVIVQKLRSIAEGNVAGKSASVPIAATGGTPNTNTGVEQAVARLQEYCNELENRLLAKFDVACQERELKSMADCARILGQFNRGSSAMQRYVAALPMFIDVEVMTMDAKTVIGEESQADPYSLDPGEVAQGLSKFYKDITDTVRKESATITVVFPSPAAVTAILVQRVLEQRLRAVLDRILVKPSLTNPIPMDKGGYLKYLRILSISYEKTLGLAKDLQAYCHDQLDCKEVAQSLFSEHKDNHSEFERASLKQLYEVKIEDLKAGALMPAQGGAIAPRASRVAFASQMPVTVVSEFVKWNEDAVARCILLSSKPATLAAHVRGVFSTFLDMVCNFMLESLKKAQGIIDDATVLRERFSIGSGSSRRVAAAAATAAEAAAVAGESSYRAFMINVQRATEIVVLVEEHFSKTIAPHLRHVDGFRAGCLEEIVRTLSSAEDAVLKGLQKCIDTIIGEVERLLAVEQKATDFKPDDGDQPPEQGSTDACVRVVAYLSRILEIANTSLQPPNKQAFLNEVGSRLQKALIMHFQRCVFSPSGAFRVKRDLSEYKAFVKTLQCPLVDKKFDILGEMVNVLIVPPESLPALLESSLKDVRKDALKFIELRDDYKTSKISKKLAAAELTKP